MLTLGHESCSPPRQTKEARMASGKRTKRLPFGVKTSGRTEAAAKTARTTLGELIVTAFDIVGNRLPDVARLLASRQLGRAARARIVVV
jgi:hypothetical protein